MRGKARRSSFSILMKVGKLQPGLSRIKDDDDEGAASHGTIGGETGREWTMESGSHKLLMGSNE